jgi:hypothetical protein
MKIIRFIWIMVLYAIIAPIVLLVGILRIAHKACEGYGLKHAMKTTINGIMSGHRINMLYVRFGKNPSIEDFES